MGISPWQLAIILIIVLIVFGGGKLPKVMGDIGKGIRNMKDGLKGENDSDKLKDGNSSSSPATTDNQAIDNQNSSKIDIKKSDLAKEKDKK